MTRRGRPPHPDVLTPREWEVLALLREGLTDQAIADRIDISLDGAKYHVREILSKLGVASRHEAAAWQPEAPAPARRWLALPVALRIAGALVMVAAVGGLGLLAWGVVRTSDEAGRQDALELPTPGSAPQLGEDEALLRAAWFVNGDSREVNGGATTWAAAKAAAGDAGLAADEPRDDAIAWFFRFTGIFLPSQIGASSGPINPDATPPAPICMAIAVYFPDVTSERGPQVSMASGLPADCSEPAPVSRELAIALAATATDIFWSRDDPPAANAAKVGLGLALEALRDRSRGDIPASLDRESDIAVWLVTLNGQFFGPEGAVPTGGTTPRPTTTVWCGDQFVILDIESHEVLFKTQAQYDACD